MNDTPRGGATRGGRSCVMHNLWSDRGRGCATCMRAEGASAGNEVK